MKIYNALGGQMRLVGGCVRDFLLGRMPEDIDLATPLLPGMVREKLSQQGIKSHPIAPRHGVVGILLDGRQFEITTLRQDTYDTGREKITFITDYARDALRRDFTINALFMDPDKVYDYCGGQTDLKAHQVRFIGDPLTRLKEDPLRLLRYIRFWACYGGEKPDKAVIRLFPTVRKGLNQVSLSRRKKEFFKILMLDKVVSALGYLREGGILPFLTEKDGLDELERFLTLYPTAGVAQRLSFFGNFIKT